MNENKSKTAVVVAGIVALVIGGGVGYAAGASMDNTHNSTTSNAQMKVEEPTAPAADLRVGMNNLLREHVSSSLNVTRNIADKSPQKDIDAAIAAQMANAGEIAAAVGSVYGEEAKAQITELFVDHINESNAYAQAVESGNEAAQQEALKEMEEYLREISAFFSGAINGLPEDTVYGLLQEHETLLNDSVVAYNNGDFAKSYELERKALTQVSGIADAIAGGIVETKPDLFKQ